MKLTIRALLKIAASSLSMLGIGCLFYAAAVHVGMNEALAMASAYFASAQITNGIDAVCKIRTAILSVDSIRESFLKYYDKEI